MLVTGHSGLKGGWLSLWLRRLGAQVWGFGLEPAHEGRGIASVASLDDTHARVLDVRDGQAVGRFVAEARPDVVFHLAAQPLVRYGYRHPAETFETNVGGTVNLLTAIEPLEHVDAVVVATSDKVYAPGAERPRREDDPLWGSDPYSASKVATELVVGAWRSSGFAFPLGTVRAGNVIGGGDWSDDRLLPDFFRATERGEPLRLRHPEATRPWQYVLDALHGYLCYAERLATEPDDAPKALNIGPEERSIPVRDLVERLQRQWGSGRWVTTQEDGPPEQPLLILDATLATRETGWRPTLTLDEALRWTTDWHRAQHDGDELLSLTMAQIDEMTERVTR